MRRCPWFCPYYELVAVGLDLVGGFVGGEEGDVFGVGFRHRGLKDVDALPAGVALREVSEQPGHRFDEQDRAGGGCSVHERLGLASVVGTDQDQGVFHGVGSFGGGLGNDEVGQLVDDRPDRFA